MNAFTVECVVNSRAAFCPLFAGTNRVGHDGWAAVPAPTRHHPPRHKNSQCAHRLVLEGKTVRLQLRHRREELHQAGKGGCCKKIGRVGFFLNKHLSFFPVISSRLYYVIRKPLHFTVGQPVMHSVGLILRTRLCAGKLERCCSTDRTHY